jgi:hypothetical protein
VVAVGAAAENPQCQIDFCRSLFEQRRAHTKNLSLKQRLSAAVAALFACFGL